jgi:ectoine hydroxylase-related dioxygenase (phytanoyl-CoA dioxygenase family)
MTTTSSYPLAHQYGETFQRTGWALVPDYLDSRDRAALREEIERVQIETLAGRSNALPYYESDAEDSRLVRIEGFWEEVPSLMNGPLGKRLADLAGELLACQAKLFKDKINFRYPGAPGYAPHQDTAAGWLDFGSRFVSICLFLEATGSASGGFEMASGAHRQGRFRNEIGRMFDADFEALEIAAIEAPPGSALVIDGEAPHRTVANRTERTSSHLIVSFVASERADPRADYYGAKRLSFENRSGGGLRFKVFE